MLTKNHSLRLRQRSAVYSILVFKETLILKLYIKNITYNSSFMNKINRALRDNTLRPTFNVENNNIISIEIETAE